jgi:hypothetical protein
MSIPVILKLRLTYNSTVFRMRASKDDIVKLKKHKGSCREVSNVYKTIEMLFTVVQYANIAFFSGDLALAYKVLQVRTRIISCYLNNILTHSWSSCTNFARRIHFGCLQGWKTKKLSLLHAIILATP